ncbi:uracil-DNA glycosylase family protein [Poseidonibacter ostreae]|jgi:G:T/U-mismatch repair DNA glycosylase|uniref:Uracil-DNA glycosylase family protein n=1 Tax=Poseidonibacter ostreae TaxID=2654171 RepID=A0A6L4WS23_9BACT|nr:uracil-DNA glycosylase family protein [Poseidonibacter ostreae]KAB7887528.1 uracil-DNA glycosylase family protein [Poseidonibacter ostreae]KAB7888413.1 uracil-DNA glycosylase family protein [Poseidonibacter ostreae]KAB7889130.1 uracil-DNA glycosylase family protein [Poseidonibacter ostreae]|tara:strand:+ start:941 stop:1603 length:663 start_codon:yes stop_codon:yes gene_type:complete
MFHHFHPYEPFIKSNTKKIIVGTLPPPRFCTKEYKENDVDFCYGSQDGLLWKSLDVIFDLNLEYKNTKEEIKKRKDFLISNNIGVCDIVNTCKREKVDASDIGMRDIELRDILGYLKKFKAIETIIFTGGNSKNGPEYFLRQILKKENIEFKQVSKEIPKVHSFIFDNRDIQTISLTSPSNAANRFIGSNSFYKEQKKINPNYTTFDFRVEQYKKVFLKD